MNSQYISSFWISNKIATNQMNNDLDIPFHDVKNYDASMDQNKPMGDNQSYLGVNSMTKASMACLKNMDDVPTEDLGVATQTFGQIACYLYCFLSSLLLLFFATTACTSFLYLCLSLGIHAMFFFLSSSALSRFSFLSCQYDKPSGHPDCGFVFHSGNSSLTLGTFDFAWSDLAL